MLKKSFLIVVMMFLIMVSCVYNKELITHDYTFHGQNGMWSGKLRVLATEVFTKTNNRLTYSCKSQENFTLSYKGKVSDLSDVKKFVYTYEGYSGGGKSTLIFDKPPTKTVFYSRSSSIGGAFEREDSIIQVKVEVDGVLTEFQLTKQM